MELNITGQTRLAALYAQPARHSISPAMHTKAFEATGTDAVYLSFDVAPEDLAASMTAVRTLGMMGVNLSMPHKMAVIPFLDELSPAAQLIGAVNTVVNEDGRLVGHNTDGVGFMRSLQDIDVDIIGKEICIIGAGGAATAIASQAAIDGVKRIYVFNRQDEFMEKFQQKAAEIAATTAADVVTVDLEADYHQLAECLKKCVLLVNATGVGMKPHDDLMPIKNGEVLHEDLAVYDVIYNPRETKLLRTAREKGLKTANGLGMLLYQGAEAFRLWTGKEMPVEIIKPLVDNS